VGESHAACDPVLCSADDACDALGMTADEIAIVRAAVELAVDQINASV
jgi:hypothetical protein